MNKIKLDYRLSQIASNVSGDVICDIGCDHGKLSYYLLSNNIVNFVYVSDISAPSLEKAINLLNDNGLQENYKAIVSDGFLAYPSDVAIDMAIISGMGGIEIKKILSNNNIDVKKYVLQPQHNEYDLKDYLIHNNYNIIKDYIIKQKDKFYNIIVCEKGNREYSDNELYFGEENFRLNKDDFKAYLKYELDKTTNLLNCVDENKKVKLKKYLDIIEKSLSRLGV
ncbi:MAG: SAM-dependent methyltransferase [Clostridia bacterium]|nr:SAM-dependent methyltransferase [Clostridia bacterium]